MRDRHTDRDNHTEIHRLSHTDKVTDKTEAVGDRDTECVRQRDRETGGKVRQDRVRYVW